MQTSSIWGSISVSFSSDSRGHYRILRFWNSYLPEFIWCKISNGNVHMCFETCFESYFETCRGARCTNVYSDELWGNARVSINDQDIGPDACNDAIRSKESPRVWYSSVTWVPYYLGPAGGWWQASMALEVGSIITIFRRGLMIREFVVQVDEKVSWLCVNEGNCLMSQGAILSKTLRTMNFRNIEIRNIHTNRIPCETQPSGSFAPLILILNQSILNNTQLLIIGSSKVSLHGDSKGSDAMQWIRHGLEA